MPEPNTQEAEHCSVTTSTTAVTSATTAPTSVPTHTRVFVNADFAHTVYKDCRLNRRQFEDYKKRFLGKPVPLQTASNDSLVALGLMLATRPELHILKLRMHGNAGLLHCALLHA